MKAMVKIIAIAAISIICFIGYTFIIGMAMGAKPAQVISVLRSSKASNAADSLLAKTSPETTDSLGNPIDSTAIAQSQGPSIDSLHQELANISKEKAELEKMKLEVSALLKAKSRADSAQIANLAKMYDGVEPSLLAQVFSNMDDSLIIAILPRLKSQKAGKILEQLPADRAARISSKLLGMN